MTTKIAKVANIALQIFSQHACRANLINGVNNQLSIEERLSDLLTSLSKIEGKDVGFDVNWINSTGTSSSQGFKGISLPAPVLYVHIMENEIFSLGIFVLRPGSRIPLHDHPEMYGMVKVIHGSVRCRSFSKYPYDKHVLSNQLNNSNLLRKTLMPRWQIDDLIAAVPYQDIMLDKNSDPMLLTPINGNFHELFTVGNDGAAFVDILAPPYDHLSGKRECHFYQEVEIPRNISNSHNISNSNIDSSGNGDDISAYVTHNQHHHHHQTHQQSDANQQQLIYLVKTHQPRDYWCDSAEYRGPRVS